MKQLASAAKHRSVAWTRMMPVAAALMVCLGLLAVTKEASSQVRAAAGARPYIVQGVTSKVAAAEVATAHGVVVSSLPIVHGVVARLTAGEADVARGSGLEVSPDLEMKVEDTGNTSSTASDVFNSVTSATSMWANGINGAGVTVAVLDTGIDTRLPDIGSRVIDGVNLINPKNPAGYKVDQYGHGTFVAGLIASNGQSSGGQYTGVAPGADLVAIKVAQASGVTTESLVIQGVAWAVAHETSDNIGVLNLSLGVAPGSPTALDPLDQAVEQAWESGIVVVTSAGNAGPGNGSITAPGDDPLVITVGSIADGGADVPANYTVPAFSSVGPTDYDGWFKPDLVAPGRSVVSLMAPASTIWTQNPQARLGKLGASDAEIVAAAKAAHAHDFILGFPGGYATPVGEHGLQLSGGQRQRIAIARALIKNAPIILLDEATAALDSESERYVQDALAELCKGRTTIVIAHRLSTIMHADCILVLEDGVVVESGRHEELLRKGGRYASFYRLQLKEQSPALEPVAAVAASG